MKKTNKWLVFDKRLSENHFSLQLAITSVDGGKVTHNGEEDQGKGQQKEHGAENDAGGSILLVPPLQSVVGQLSKFGGFLIRAVLQDRSQTPSHGILHRIHHVLHTHLSNLKEIWWKLSEKWWNISSSDKRHTSKPISTTSMMMIVSTIG